MLAALIVFGKLQVGEKWRMQHLVINKVACTKSKQVDYTHTHTHNGPGTMLMLIVVVVVVSFWKYHIFERRPPAIANVYLTLI